MAKGHHPPHRYEVDDRVELVVPPELTKGPFPHGISKDSTAIFVVELLAVS